MRSPTIACIFLSFLSGRLFLSGVSNAADTKAEELIAKNLDSIGTAEARAAVKSRAIQGPLHFKDLSGNLGEQVGYWGYVSDQHKSNFVMKFGSGDWRGERFVFDGDKTQFAVFTSSRRPSSFGEFVRWQDFILKEGLLGGELSAAWVLEKPDRIRAKLEYLGLKKIDGHEMEAVEYQSKSNDMKVTLYFDPETHHHAMTLYSLVWNEGMGFRPRDSVNQHQIRYTIEERFSDFQTDNLITLPRHYDLRYTHDPQKGQSAFYDWDMTAEKVLSNITLDPQNFEIK
jgi:hypothetical protein